MRLHIREIDHVVLRVRDMDRMVRFYAEVVGAELVAFRPKFNMTHLRAGSAMIDLGAGDPGAGRNMDHFCCASNRSTLRRQGEWRLDLPHRPEGNEVELKGPSDGKPPPD